MQAIRTVKSNFTYLGPAPDVADLPGQREAGHFYAVFQFTDDEREMIAKGAQVRLGVFQEPIPPISMAVVNEAEAPGLEQDGVPVEPDFRCEQCSNLYVSARAIDELKLKCGWCGGELHPVST